MTQTAPPNPRPLDDTQVIAADRTTSLPVTALDEESRRSRLLDLSVTQILGGSMAAATAAFLGSRLGLLGTITGAAIGSVVTAVAANLYTNSMARAREAVVLARAYNRGAVESRRPHWWRLPDRAGSRRLLATAGVLFAVAAAFLTGVQLTTGAQVTGTTIGRSAAAPAVDAPSGSDASGVSRSSGTDASRVGTKPTSAATGTPTPAATTDAPASGGAAGTTGTSTGGASGASGTSTPDASSTGTATAPAGGADPQSPPTGTLPADQAPPTP